MSNIKMPSVVFRLDNQLFAIPTDAVMAIIKMPTITFLPNCPASIRGMIKYRNQIFRLFDLRQMMNMISLEDEKINFDNLMNERAEDHKNWLTELELSVNEKREFKLTTDPHKCKFGQWYDHYETDNIFIQEILKKFDAPHKIIHAIAEKVIHLVNKNDHESAIKLITETRDGELATMLKLFDEIKLFHRESKKELAIVISKDDIHSAISVDSVQSVEYLEDVNEEITNKNILNFAKNDFITGLKKSNDTAMIINLTTDAFLSGSKGQLEIETS